MSPPILFLVGVLLVVAVGGEVASRALLDGATAALQLVGAAREDLDSLVRQQLAEEIGLRGYIATGERSFLAVATPDEPFELRAQRLRRELAAAELPDATARVAAFSAARARWQTTIERPLLDDPHRSDALALQFEGRPLLATMRTSAASIRADLHGADHAIAEKLRWRINGTIAASIGTIAVFAVVALRLGFARSQALAELVRKESLVTALQRTLRVDGVQLPRTAVGFAYTSATREALVGGDLIDTWRAGDEGGWFLIADASGKGIAAARLAAFVQYAIRTLSAQCSDPAHVLTRFNLLFLDTFDDPTSFVVALLGAYDSRTGTLRYASAGHATAFISRPDGIEQLMPTGPIIGLDRDQTYAERTVRLAVGETVVLATDGLTECRDAAGEMLGDDGVMALLHGVKAEPQALCDRLVDEVQRRSRGEVTDDLAILVVRILGTDSPSIAVPFSTLNA